MHQQEMQKRNMTLMTVGTDSRVAEGFRRYAEQGGWTVTDIAFATYISHKRRPHLPEQVRSCESCLAVLNFDKGSSEAADSAAYLHQLFGEKLTLVAAIDSMQPDEMMLAMRAGCTELIAPSHDAGVAEAIIDRLEERMALRAKAGTTEGAILSLIGAKGGVGTTTLAVHLATYLVERAGKRVLLVDNQAQFGHVCIYLGLDGTSHHFQDVVSNIHRLDNELLQGLVAKHACGLDVLSSPDAGEVARTMHPDDVLATLEYLRTEYDFVIVDCAGRLDAVSRAVIGSSSCVYVVATPEISAVRDLSRYVDDLSAEGDSAKVKVVLNRYSSKYAVSTAEIEKAIRAPVAFSVPNSYIELVRSANLGTPLSSTLANGFTEAMVGWTESLVGQPGRASPLVARTAVEPRPERWSARWLGIIRSQWQQERAGKA